MENSNSFDLSKSYKELPIENRADLLVTAQNLLQQQKNASSSNYCSLPSNPSVLPDFYEKKPNQE